MALPIPISTTDRPVYASLLNDYQLTFSPATTEETELAQELALLHIRLNQARHMETALIEFRIQSQLEAESLTAPRDEAHASRLWAGVVAGDDFPRLKALWQRQDRLTRQIDRTRKQLRESVHTRESAEPRPVKTEKTGETNSPAPVQKIQVINGLPKIPEKSGVPNHAAQPAEIHPSGSGQNREHCYGQAAPPASDNVA